MPAQAYLGSQLPGEALGESSRGGNSRRGFGLKVTLKGFFSGFLGFVIKPGFKKKELSIGFRHKKGADVERCLKPGDRGADGFFPQVAWRLGDRSRLSRASPS